MKKPQKIKPGSLYDSGEGPAPPPNPRYLKISGYYRAAQAIILIIMFAFIFFMFGSHGESITYENLSFLLKDLNLIISAGGKPAAGGIRYAADLQPRFAVFRGGLAVLGKTSLTLFNAGGRQTLSVSLRYSDPRLCVSGKYLFAYDLGGREVGIYNSYINIETLLFDYPVSGVCASDDGSFAVVTQSLEHTSSVIYYNNKFQISASYNSRKFIASASLDRSGEHLLIVSTDASEGFFQTEISLYRTGEKEDLAGIKIAGLFPVGAGFFSGGGFYVLGDTQLLFYGNGAERLGSHEYGGFVPLHYAAGEDAVAVICKNSIVGGENSVFIFDTGGKILYNEGIDGKIIDLTFDGGDLYVMTDRMLHKINSTGGGSIAEYPLGAVAVAARNGRVYVCFPGHARVSEAEPET